MSKRRSKEPTESRLTPGQRRWLRHLRAAERSGETIKDYAARHGLSVQSAYQAGKRLRRLGVIEARVVQRPEVVARSWVKAELPVARREGGAAWRMRLPNGWVFESSAPLAPEELLSLLVELAAPR
jgi:hypothetical protein